MLRSGLLPRSLGCVALTIVKLVDECWCDLDFLLRRCRTQANETTTLQMRPTAAKAKTIARATGRGGKISKDAVRNIPVTSFF